MTKLELNKILDEAITYAENANLPINRSLIRPIVGINKRKKALGICKVERVYHQRYGMCDMFSISISEYCLTCDSKTIRNTIAHEVIHCCKGCYNHGTTFRHYANILSNIGNYTIGTHASFEESAEFNSNIIHKYTVTCNGCGQVWGKDRKRGIVEYPKRYKHSCGCIGDFTVVMNY